MYDAIVVGAGHNGLTCAGFLAKAGKRVLVLEANADVGGLCLTHDMPNAPGYRVSPASVEFVLPSVHPRVEDQLDLAKYGLRWVVPDALTTWLGPDGASVGFYQNIELTKREIARYSRKDAQRYGELVECLNTAMMTILPYMQGHPWRVRPGTLGKVLVNAAKGRNHLAKGARAFMGSIDGVMDEWFEREEVKAPIAAYCAGTFGPITESGTGFHLTFLTGIHTWGVRRPLGGSGAFTQALAAAVRGNNGEIRTNARVARIKTRDGVARGVILANGEEIDAKDVICAVDPTTLLTKLVDPGDLPAKTHDEIGALQVGRFNVLYFDVELALSGRPKFPGYSDRDDNYLSTLMLCPTMDYMRRSTLDGMNGTFTSEIPMATLSSSVYDRTLVPNGSTGETLKFYAFNTPIELADGRSWEDEKEKYYQATMDHFELYAPHTRDLVIDAYLTAPPDFEQRYNVHGGNYEHADLTIAQIGPTRPIPSLAGWKTPIKHLWHSGAGSFPMAYVSGWPGRGTAQALLRQERFSAPDDSTAQGHSIRKRRIRPLRPTARVPPLCSNGVGLCLANARHTKRCPRGRSEEDPHMPSEAEAVVAAFLAAWGPDWPTFRSAYVTFLSADCVYENTGMPTATGHTEILALVDAFAAATGMVSGEATVRHSFASDTVVLNERTEIWRRADGTPIIDQPVAVMGAFEVHDGRITHWRDYWDASPVMAILTGAELEQPIPADASGHAS